MGNLLFKIDVEMMTLIILNNQFIISDCLLWEIASIKWEVIVKVTTPYFLLLLLLLLNLEHILLLHVWWFHDPLQRFEGIMPFPFIWSNFHYAFLIVNKK